MRELAVERDLAAEKDLVSGSSAIGKGSSGEKMEVKLR